MAGWKGLSEGAGVCGGSQARRRQVKWAAGWQAQRQLEPGAYPWNRSFPCFNLALIVTLEARRFFLSIVWKKICKGEYGKQEKAPLPCACPPVAL